MDKSYNFKLNPNYPDGTDAKNPIKIYSDGVFDCFHYGHARLFEKIKGLFPHVYLIVGVCLDEDIEREKAAPIMTQDQRKECIRHCKWVDEIVDAPWLPTIEYVDKIGGHYMAHDAAPYKFGDIEDVYGEFKINNRFIATTRTEGISTTDIINKIIMDYDVYVKRAIKKNTPIDELNLNTATYIKYKSYEIGDKVKNFITEVAKNVYEHDNSKLKIKKFLEEKK